MARTYRYTALRRIGNVLMTAALKLGVGPGNTRLLSVRGRKTGRTYTTPVNLVERNGRQFLVAPYGDVSWVRNARAAGRVTLRRGRTRETRRLEALSPPDATPVLADYWQQNPITRPYFEAAPGDGAAAFTAEAAHHPVFRLV